MLCGPNRPPFWQKSLYGKPLGGTGRGISASSVGLAGFETSTTEAWFRGSLQSSRIDSELTRARLRIGSGSALCAPMLPRNGGVNGNCPTFLMWAGSDTSRITRPAAPNGTYARFPSTYGGPCSDTLGTGFSPPATHWPGTHQRP